MMKFLTNRSWGRFALFAMFALGVHGLVSCSKSETAVEAVNPADLSKIAVNVLGINDLDEVSTAIMPVASKSPLRTDVATVGKFEAHNSFDALISVAETQATKNRVLLKEASLSSIKKAPLMAVAMASGIKYRLMLYSVVGTTETFWKSVELTSAGTTGQMVDVMKGTNYKWYAFSYNTNAPVPDLDHNNPVIASGNNDLLYASGTVIVSGAGTVNKPLNITFAHKTGQVVVEFDARGMFTDNLKAISMTFGPNQLFTSDLNIKSGAMSTPVAYSPAAIDISTFVNVEPSFSDRKKAYFYTSKTGNITDMKVNLHSFTIVLEDVTDRNFTGVNREFKFASVPAAAAKSYTAKIDLIESPVIVTATSLATVKWGRANLFYKGDGQRNPYRFRIQNSGVHNSTSADFFRYLDSKPGNAAIPIFGSVLNNRDGIDPCGLVYPAGIWRTPTRAEYDNLNNMTTGRTFVAADHVEYTGLASNVGAPYLNKNLRLERNGWHQKDFSGIFYIPFVTAPREGYYWSSTANYLFNIAGTTSANGNTDVKQTREWPTSFLYTGHNWASVRCVRTAGN